MLEAEAVSVAEFRESILVFGIDTLKNHLSDKVLTLIKLNMDSGDRFIDLLFLVGKEYVFVAIAGYKCLFYKQFKSLFDLDLKFHSVIINMRYHKTGDVLDCRYDFLDILDKEKRFQNIDSEIVFFTVRIDIRVIESAGNNRAMGMVKKLLQ